jgi:hypothetical protein
VRWASGEVGALSASCKYVELEPSSASLGGGLKAA